MEENNRPEHEKIKKELLDKFTATTTYLGSHVKNTISQTSFKIAGATLKPTEIKVGDVITTFIGSKSRPAVIVKVLQDRTMILVPLTSTENIHCLTPYKSRFFGEGCFSKTVEICSEEFALEHFIGTFDNNTALKLAKKELKEFLIKNL